MSKFKTSVLLTVISIFMLCANVFAIDVSEAKFKELYNLEIGTDVQAYDADLTSFASVTPSANGLSLMSAADYAAMKALLDLEIGTDVQAYDADLTTYAGITPAANVQSILGAADYAAIKTLLSLDTMPVSFLIDVSADETTDITTGTAKFTFRAPYAFTLTDVRASLTSAGTDASVNVDINEGGTSVLSTVITIDSTELTSTTAATPAVISDSAIADDASITIDIDQIGSTAAGKGLKVWLIGTIAR